MIACSPPTSAQSLRLLWVLVASISSALLAGCTPVIAESSECLHGVQDGGGKCTCDPCWAGEHCDQYAKRKPIFFQKTAEVYLSPEHEDGDLVYTAEAVDMDETYACQAKQDCPCAQIHYSIISGNDDLDFHIDSDTGVITTTGESLPFQNKEYILEISADNPGSDEYDVLKLTVHVPVSWDDNIASRYLVEPMGDGYMEPPLLHSIHKRAVYTPPGNVTFVLIKTGVSENITEMRVGTRISFQLQIIFPQNSTDMLVELFAPDNETMVMMLCKVVVQPVGASLSFTGTGTPVLDSANGSTTLFDRAVIDFGNVTFKSTPTSEADVSIYITWDAVMIDNVQTQNSTVYWVSAGAEYNYENEVWVGQASFTAITTAEPISSFAVPTFNLSGPDTMEIGSSAVFTLTMYLPLPSVYLNVDVFAPLNVSDVMTVCGMKVRDTGSNYVCGFLPSEHNATLYADDNTRGYGRARLQLGTLTNKGAREAGNPPENNRITVEFVVKMYEDVSYVGQSYWVGAAVEIGKSQIWAGEIAVRAVARDTTRMINPSWNVTKMESGGVSTLKPVVVNIDIKIPRYSVLSYALEALTPVENSEAVLQLCSVAVTSFGDNVPCTSTSATASYFHRGSLPMYMDRSYLDLGVVSNVGPWGWQPANATFDPDTIRLRMLVKATNHSLATAGSSHSVTLGLFINDQRLLVTSVSLQVEADAIVPNVTNETSPDWGLTWAYGSGNIQVGSTAQILMTITTKRNTIYAPFDIEAIMPNSSSYTMLSICRLRAYSVGKNLPCTLNEAINSSVYYTSDSSYDNLSSRAVVNMPSLCNYEFVNSTTEDQLVLELSFRVENGSSNGTEFWPSMGIMFSPYRMWIGQIKMWARTDQRVNSGVRPYISVFKSDLGGVPIGYYAFYTIIIKTNPGDTIPYLLNVSTSAAGYGVCSVRVIKIGNHMPCTNASTLAATYERNTDSLNNKATLSFGLVSNTATGNSSANNTFDDDTIQVEVVISVPTTAVSGALVSFTVVMSYGGTVYSPTVPSFNITSDTSIISKRSSNVTDFQLSVIPITATDNGTSVVLGQVKRFQLCAWTVPSATSVLSFKLIAPTSSAMQQVEVTYFGLLAGGSNLPCYSGPCGKGTATYSIRTTSYLYNDLAVLDLGYVYNTGIDLTNPDANKVCADGMVRVLKDSGLSPGNKVSMNASVSLNGQEFVSQLLDLTVVGNETFADIYLDNITIINGSVIDVNLTFPNPVKVHPGDVQTIPLIVSIPPYVTSLVTMDVRLEKNQSACMTFKEVRLIGVGRNLKGFGKAGDFICTGNSTLGTTQMDVAVCELGIVTNAGFSHTCGSVVTDDDSIILEVDLQLADCLIATNNTILMASFGLKVASFVAIGDQAVTVSRTGLEQPVFNITAQTNSTSDTIYVNFDIRLDNTSSAELYNASLLLYPPPYVTCSKVVRSAGTSTAPLLTADTKKVAVSLGTIFFTDVISLLIQCNVSTKYPMPEGISGYHTILPYQLYGDVIPRTPTLLNTTTFFSDLAFVNFTSTTSSGATTCTPAALGMADATKIKDCQILGSYESITSVLNGRKGGSGWQPYLRDGDLLAKRYLQVYFANKVMVYEVEVEQNAATKTTRLKLSYSDDGVSFVDGSEISLLMLDTQRVPVPSPRESRVLRVYAVADNSTGQAPSLSFEFYGCVTSTDVTGDPCLTAPTNAVTNSLYYRRSFLTASSSVFVCDGIVEAKGVQQRCFSSTDGIIWKPLDSRLGSMVGFESAGSRVFALANDGVTYMNSGDNGLTWSTSRPLDVQSARLLSTFAPAVNVPWNGNLVSGDPALSYQQGEWGAAFDGLKQNSNSVWNTRVKWNCC